MATINCGVSSMPKVELSLTSCCQGPGEAETAATKTKTTMTRTTTTTTTATCGPRILRQLNPPVTGDPREADEDDDEEKGKMLLGVFGHPPAL